MNGAAPQWTNSIDAILEDNKLMKMHMDVQNCFPIYHVCPKCMAALLCGDTKEGLNIPENRCGRMTLVDW